MTFGSRFGRGLVAAMEDEALDTAGEVETGADSAEAAVAEVSEVSSDIDTATSEIDSAVADAETLETITEKVEATEETGGLTPEAAEVVEVAVEAIYARLGIRSNPLPAMEGFNSSSARVRTTHIAVEDWKQKIKDIWKAIVNAFKRVYEWIVSFFKGIFDANAKLASRANALIAGLKSADGKTAKSKEISAGSFVNKLVTKSGWNTQKAVDAVNKAGFQEPISALLSAGRGIGENTDIAGCVSDEAKFEAFSVDAPDGMKKIKAEEAAEGMAWYGAEDLPGNKKIAIQLPLKEIKGKAAWQTAIDFKVIVSNSKLDVKKEKVDTLSLEQISSIAKSTLQNVADLNNSKSHVAAMESQLKNAIQAATNIAQQTPKDEGYKERSEMIAKAFSSMSNSVIKFYNTVMAHVTVTNQAGLDYAEKSIKEYTGEASNDKKKK